MKKDRVLQDTWKKNLVLLAKNTYVWLNQLSTKYGYEVNTLDQIPLAELEAIRELGITGIWLIGIWERSPASKIIKSLYGFKDAAASAYSIYEYEIAKELGGKTCYETFRKKANSVGLKIGCDIVPNHMGIDSPLFIEHPDWFIKADSLPNTDWKFTSTNLSQTEGIEIRIEDGYYNRSGAAEVFSYKDLNKNKVRYIYHGNDGTSMPWNDTTQLNYLLPEVRNKMREIILHVASLFDIIRLDAAMTLTKRHFKRLWFPSDNGERCIPSREPYEMDEETFDKKMPDEFWNQVVNEVEEKEPDTLLIAEAFWLMEGFFIKHLGMHRVYNSAFMNMIKEEQNAKIRNCLREMAWIKENALEHLVNYQTTPDEESAIIQFGDREKYFGACTLMCTLPGLPMFGHGQFEGYRERYGMDYLVPHMNEQVNESLIEKHKLLITPILNNRNLFSSASNFEIKDIVHEGELIDDIIAFINQTSEGRILVLFNNSPLEKTGKLSFKDNSDDQHQFSLNSLRNNIDASPILIDSNYESVNIRLKPYEAQVYLITAA